MYVDLVLMQCVAQTDQGPPRAARLVVRKGESKRRKATFLPHLFLLYKSTQTLYRPHRARRASEPSAGKTTYPTCSRQVFPAISFGTWLNIPFPTSVNESHCPQHGD